MSLMKTIGYVRVSTDKQADRGVSLEAQAEKIRAMAVVHNAKLVDIIVDGGESAKSLNRPGMARLLTMVDAGEVQTVIIAKLDRLTRSVKDLCTLLERFERRGVALVSVAESLDTGSAAGRLVLNIMTAVSQWEREAIGERTRDAMSHKRTNGERVGNIQFGYRLGTDGKHVVLDEIRRLRQSGTTLRGIAATLNHRGHRTRRGSAWRLEHVARITKQD
jgi:site-specific DNA recombinase